jgi:hypothetical protein
MLDLAAPRQTVAGVSLAADHDDPLVRYVLPPPPSASRPDGVAEVQLLRFAGAGRSGGHLSLAVQLSYPDSALAAAAAQLTGGRSDGRAVTLMPVPLVAGEAELYLYDKQGPTDHGRALVQLSPPYRTVFAQPLDPASTDQVDRALRTGDLPLGVICRLTVEGLWPASQVTARVDWQQVYEHLSSDYRVGALLVSEDISHLVEDLVQRRVIQVHAVDLLTDPAIQSSVDSALAWVQSELVERFCEPVLPLDRTPAQASLGGLGDLLNIGSAFVVKSLTEIEQGVASVDFQQSRVVPRTIAVSAQLTDLLAGDDPAAHIAEAGADHPFFQRFTLGIRPARPLAVSHLQEAVVNIAYGSANAAIRLAPGTEEGTFSCWADASTTGTWNAGTTVTFTADSPVSPGAVVALPALTDGSRELTLDLDAALGLSHVDIQRAADPRVTASLVHVVQRGTDADRDARDLALTQAQPTASAWFRGRRDGDRLIVAVEHLLTDGRQVTVAPFAADTSFVLLPDPYAGVQTVTIITPDDWSQLSRIAVSVCRREGGPVRTFTFDAPGSAVCGLDLTDPLDRSYRYRVSTVDKNAVTSDGPWLDSDLAVLLVGSGPAGQLVVDIDPVGVEPPEAGLRSIDVELLYVDAAHLLRCSHTHVITAKADRYTWQVQLADPNLRSYQYRITRHTLAGTQSTAGWMSTSDTVLPIPITPS